MTNKSATLFHYVHCPFCVRVRMALGYLGQNYDSKVLPYNDEKTPIDLMGVKMLPIFKFKDGKVSNESLEIIKVLDEENKLNIEHYSNNQESIDSLLDAIGKDVHSMAMPYWIWSPEFNDDSRKYFQDKKEKKRGPFKDLVLKQNEFKSGLNKTLKNLEEQITPFYKSSELTISDILIASHLWGMFIVPEFQFSDKIYNYLMTIKDLSDFDYHEDFWR